MLLQHSNPTRSSRGRHVACDSLTASESGHTAAGAARDRAADRLNSSASALPGFAFSGS